MDHFGFFFLGGEVFEATKSILDYLLDWSFWDVSTNVV